jgi:hypothetical protein
VHDIKSHVRLELQFHAVVGAFAKLRKVTINFVIYVCLSVSLHGKTGLQLNDIHKIWYLGENLSFIQT